jgi:hypothetical protein
LVPQKWPRSGSSLPLEAEPPYSQAEAARKRSAEAIGGAEGSAQAAAPKRSRSASEASAGKGTGKGSGKASPAAKAAAIPATESKDVAVSYSKDQVAKYTKAERTDVKLDDLIWDVTREHGQPRSLKPELWSKYYRQLLQDGPPSLPFANGLGYMLNGVPAPKPTLKYLSSPV